MAKLKQRLIFFCRDKRNEGYILRETPTHFKIKDVISNKEIWLAKMITNVEVKDEQEE